MKNVPIAIAALWLAAANSGCSGTAGLSDSERTEYVRANTLLLDAFPTPPGGRLAATSSGRYSDSDTSGPTLGMVTYRTYVFRSGFKRDPIAFYTRNSPEGWKVVKRRGPSIALRRGNASVGIKAMTDGTSRVQLSMDSRC